MESFKCTSNNITFALLASIFTILFSYFPHMYQVSYVPTSLANDLVHYPAPFLIGVVPSEERELLDNLPDDVTLVSNNSILYLVLVNRLILFSLSLKKQVDLDSSVITLANDMSSANYSTSKATTSNLENTQEKKLKAQLHSLSKRLGHIVGQEIFPSAWCCDSINYNALNVGSKTSFFKLKSIFNDFIIELLEGMFYYLCFKQMHMLSYFLK